MGAGRGAVTTSASLISSKENPKKWRNALHRVASFSHLAFAWRELHSRATARSKKTVGVDGQSINEFRVESTYHLKRLSYELTQRLFRFRALQAHRIPKSNGKIRIICVPTVYDRVVQRALLEYLTVQYKNKFENEVSYGFVRDRTVKKAVDTACNCRRLRRWVYKTDIESFFDRIERAHLCAQISRYIREKSLRNLLFDAVDCEVDDSRRSIRTELKKQNIHKGKGVRQGMPLSPFFANLVLKDFDAAITAHGLSAIRYADDLIFFATSKEQCLSIHEFCRKELLKLGHTIPDYEPNTNSKTEIFAPDETADFLGLGITPQGSGYVAKVTSKQLAKIREQLLMLSSPKELVTRGIRLANFDQALTNRVNGYLHAYEDCANAVQVANELSSVSERVRRIIYRDHLKIDFNSISSEARAFIGI